MKLDSLKPADGSRQSEKRLGRGIGSGLGKTCSKGHKGQKARSGGSIKPGFEGGQMPLQRRLSKVGFVSRQKATVQVVSVGSLAVIDGDEVSLQSLRLARLVRGYHKRVRVVVREGGELGRALRVTDPAVRLSEQARGAIVAAGGIVVS